MNLNLCAIDRKTRYCRKCDTYLRVSSPCIEFSEEMNRFDPDSGEWVYDDMDLDGALNSLND